MSSQVYRALFKDALYQVLDNRVFRLLAVLTLVLVLPTFLIAAKEDSVVLLFGWKEYYYENIFAFFNMPFPGKEDANETLIQFIQLALVDRFVGTFGIMFSVAATAFFVPRMIEKGSADMLFSKPVSRFALMFSRHLAGLIFVALLSTILVGGMHLGFMTQSGYSDPGFLWSIFTLIYLFAILHTVSVVVGVFTRSTVAAILLTLMFMAFNGCVHIGWTIKEMAHDRIDLEEITNDQVDEAEEFDALADFATTTLNVLHYTLPKTSDAERFGQMLRRSVEPTSPEFKDVEVGIRAGYFPAGFERAGDSILDDEVTWKLQTESGPVEISLQAYPKDQIELPDLPRLRSANMAEVLAEARLAEVRGDELVPSNSIRESRTDYSRWIREEGFNEIDDRISGARILQLEWLGSEDGTLRDHVAWYFGWNQYAFRIDFAGPEFWRSNAENGRELQGILGAIRFEDLDFERIDPKAWYSSKFGWSAPLKFNAWFSLGSTLAFVLILFGLGMWKLKRIDF